VLYKLFNYLCFLMKARIATFAFWVIIFCYAMPTSGFTDVDLDDFSMKLSGNSFVKNEIFSLNVESKGYYPSYSRSGLSLTIPKKLSSKDIDLVNVRISQKVTGISLSDSKSGRQRFHFILTFEFKSKTTGNLELPILPIAFEDEEPFLYTPRLTVRIIESRFEEYAYLFWTGFGLFLTGFIITCLRYRSGKISNYKEIQTYRRFLKLRNHEINQWSLRKLLSAYLSDKYNLNRELKGMIDNGDFTEFSLEGDIKNKLQNIFWLSDEKIQESVSNHTLDEKIKTILFLIHDKNKESAHERRNSGSPKGN